VALFRKLQASFKTNGIAGVLLLAAAGVFIWLAWSVSLWLVLAFGLHWLLRTISERLEQDRKLGKRGLTRAAVEIGAHSLSHVTFYIGVGIFIVALLQIGLWATSELIEPKQVRQLEELLSWSYHSLKHALDFHVLAIALVGLIAVTLLAPRAEIVGPFFKARTAAMKVSFILLGVTSFTFFSALELDRRDTTARAAERYQARINLEKIDDHTRDIAAAAWIASEVTRLDQQKKREYGQFFQLARTTRYPTQIVQAAAGELAAKAPKVNPRTVQPTSIEQSIVSNQLQQYFAEDSAPRFSAVDEPSLTEIRAANDRLSRHELRLRAVRTAAIEFAAETIAEIATNSERALVNAFVQELTHKLSKSALHEVVPRRLDDIAAGKEWVKTHLTGASAVERGAIAHSLAINPASLEAPLASGRLLASEAAVAAVLSRLNTQQVRMHGPPSVRPPAISLPHSVSTSSYRIRVRR
jgi:hypothetical protein